MPSPRIDPRDWSSFDPRGLPALIGRLNVRLVMALAVVALVGLITSGIAIQQILPGFFAEQTELQLAAAAGSTALSLRETVTRIGSDPQTEATATLRELRDGQIATNVAAQAARVFSATVTILNDLGRMAARASPPDI